MSNPNIVDYEADNEDARVFVATADTSLDALLKCLDRAHSVLGSNAIILGAHTTNELVDSDDPSRPDLLWWAQVVAS